MEKAIIDDESEFRQNSLKVLKGTGLSIVITLILLLVFSAILTYTNVSENVIPIAIIAITGFSILVGSAISTIKIKKNGMINGALSGLVYMIILYLVSSVENGFILNLKSFIMLVVALIMGAIGGIIGVNMR